MTKIQNAFSASLVSICVLAVVVSLLSDLQAVSSAAGLSVAAVATPVAAQPTETSLPDATVIFAGHADDLSEEIATF